MDVIFLFFVGFLVLIIVFLSLFNMVGNRLGTSKQDLNDKVMNLEKRLNKLESEKN